MRFLALFTFLVGCAHDKEPDDGTSEITDSTDGLSGTRSTDTPPGTDTDLPTTFDSGTHFTDYRTDTGTTDTGGPAPGLVPWTLRNADVDCDPLEFSVVAPSPGEDGHLAAARLTPPGWPFTVTDVSWTLRDDAQCDGGAAYRVDLWVEAGNVPSQAPAILQSVAVPAGVPAASWSTSTVALNPPITLQPGESLFVGVEMQFVSDQDHSCIQTCKQATTPEADWWSGAAKAPYPWAELGSFGVTGDYTIAAGGVLAAADFPCVVPDGDAGGATGANAIVDSTSGAGVIWDPSCTSLGDPKLQRGWTWTAPAAGTYTFDTTGSAMPDTVLVLLDGCGFQELECNDDVTAGVDLQSRASHTFAAGEQVLVVVGGVKGNAGDYVVSITP